MRTVRITLTLALAVLIATPLLAGEGKKRERGKGAPGARAPGMFGAMGNSVPRILARLNLSDDEKAATEAIVKEFSPKIAAAQKEAAPTEDQRAAIKEAMTELRGKEGVTREQMTEAINKAAKWTEKQTAARKKAAALVEEETKAVLAKLTDANKEAFKKASERRPGGPGAPGTRTRGKRTTT